VSHLIENILRSELEDILYLNESEVPHVGSVDIERMIWFADNADYFRVARIDGDIGGFLIGMRPGSNYQSPNYRWFCDRYEDFAYVDRVVVTVAARGRGLAAQLYSDFAARMPDSVTAMTCEVNIEPPNDGSMQFHTKLGFREVGTLTSGAGDKKVALLLKDL
jgi:predicted GNAT superfamily acetyltransferase